MFAASFIFDWKIRFPSICQSKNKNGEHLFCLRGKSSQSVCDDSKFDQFIFHSLSIQKFVLILYHSIGTISRHSLSFFFCFSTVKFIWIHSNWPCELETYATFQWWERNKIHRTSVALGQLFECLVMCFYHWTMNSIDGLIGTNKSVKQAKFKKMIIFDFQFRWKQRHEPEVVHAIDVLQHQNYRNERRNCSTMWEITICHRWWARTFDWSELSSKRLTIPTSDRWAHWNSARAHPVSMKFIAS